MNRQQVFDRVAAHLLRQNARSMRRDRGDMCAYRGAGGLQCAVGCLITDTAYVSTLEGLGPFDASVRHALEKSGVPIDPDTSELLSDLQAVHDYEAPSAWRSQLTTLAAEYGLTFKEVSNGAA